MAARIVFADGSKGMAHNTNDLFERWLLRRGQLPIQQQTPEALIEEFLPDLTEPTTQEEVKALRELLQEKRGVLIARISALNTDRHKYKWDGTHFARLRAPIASAIGRVELQMSLAKTWASAYPELDAVTPLELKNKLIAAQERIIELQDVIIGLQEQLNAARG